MSRPTHVQIDSEAVLYNLNQIKSRLTRAQVVAMVKANAYGCGVAEIVAILQDKVAAFGVASIEEGLQLRTLTDTPCIVFQGIFDKSEIPIVEKASLQVVVHHQQQVDWLTTSSQSKPLKIWLKVNTGMNRLGILPTEIPNVLERLQQCSWIDQDIVVMTHLACADEANHPKNDSQVHSFNALPLSSFKKSIINSAGILNYPELEADYVRPGIMLYGISPVKEAIGQELGLLPAIHFKSKIIAIQQCAPGETIGYSATWQTPNVSKIAVIPVGYGDGYPRHIQETTYVWIQGQRVPIVGRISMDTMTIDVTALPNVNIGEEVELWGRHIPIEEVAKNANTIPYELLTKLTARGRGKLTL